MKILVTGSTGLIGSSLCRQLSFSGHQVVPLLRSTAQTNSNAVYWNPAQDQLTPQDLLGFDAIVHLAGENIAKKRWSADFKRQLERSRVNSTKLLVEAISQLSILPKIVISASAIGFYGDRADSWLNEESSPGKGFLPNLCQAWEGVLEPLANLGIRLINARFGMVLSKTGGALKKMLLPFKLGLGGRIGNGHQYISWISLTDATRAIQHCLLVDELNGPINFSSPNPVTNNEFSTTLARLLNKPARLPLPSFLAKIFLGQMAEELILASTRVYPQRLLDSGFAFNYPTLESALKLELS